MYKRQEIYFKFSGVLEPLKILILVDVILGPILTFIVFKKGKKSLKLDLSLIAAFQLAAFLYGVYSIYLGKPSLVVHRTGYYEVVIEKSIDYDALSQEMKGRSYWLFPIYGKIESEELSSFSYASDYLDKVSLIDRYNEASYPKPLSVEDVEKSTENSSPTTKLAFENLKNSDKDLIFYDVKYGYVFWIMVIDKSTMEVIEFLEL